MMNSVCLLNRILTIVSIMLSMLAIGGIITMNSKISSISSVQADTINMFNLYIDKLNISDKNHDDVKVHINNIEQQLKHNEEVFNNRLQHIIDIITYDKQNKK